MPLTAREINLWLVLSTTMLGMTALLLLFFQIVKPFLHNESELRIENTGSTPSTYFVPTPMNKQQFVTGVQWCSTKVANEKKAIRMVAKKDIKKKTGPTGNNCTGEELKRVVVHSV